mmetsp:Transcript_60446/g.129655  ORF Transcript_60446/g.129655 Transcript_60446/m.129655 type:complete len:253 (+) Transcript_60446:383-1141(+)
MHNRRLCAAFPNFRRLRRLQRVRREVRTMEAAALRASAGEAGRGHWTSLIGAVSRRSLALLRFRSSPWAHRNPSFPGLRPPRISLWRLSAPLSFSFSAPSASQCSGQSLPPCCCCFPLSFIVEVPSMRPASGTQSRVPAESGPRWQASSLPRSRPAMPWTMRSSGSSISSPWTPPPCVRSWSRCSPRSLHSGRSTSLSPGERSRYHCAGGWCLAKQVLPCWCSRTRRIAASWAPWAACRRSLGAFGLGTRSA